MIRSAEYKAGNFRKHTVTSLSTTNERINEANWSSGPTMTVNYSRDPTRLEAIGLEQRGRYEMRGRAQIRWWALSKEWGQSNPSQNQQMCRNTLSLSVVAVHAVRVYRFVRVTSPCLGFQICKRSFSLTSFCTCWIDENIAQRCSTLNPDR